MNKKLLAVAVAGALAAPVAAFAQSSVTLYGIADVAYVSKTHTSANGATASKLQGIGEGLNAGNRVGFRGSEDLGGGMSAQFLIEQGINITNGALFSTRAAAAGQQYDGLGIGAGNMPAGAYSTSTNRQSFVGLKGGWGEILAGYQYTILYRISTLSGFFVGSEQPGGDLAHGTLDNANYGGTRANGFVYNSPKFSDFQLTVQRGAAGGREDASFSTANSADGKTENDAHRWGAMLNYNKGPFNATLGYTKITTDSATPGSATCPLNVLGACTSLTVPAAAASVDSKAHLWQLGASYVINSFKLVGSYSKGKRDEAVSATGTKSKAYQGGVEFTAGAWRPFITLGRGKTETAAGVETGDFKLTQFGLRYDLSKRTTVYAMHGTTKDGAAVGAALSKRAMTGLGMMMSF